MQQDNTIPHYGPQNTPPSPPESPHQNPEPYHGSSGGGFKKSVRRFLSNFGIIIAAPLIALLLINFVFQSYEVDGPSMEQTLQDNDRLVVLKIGKTIANIKNEAYVPDRGSIIIFHKSDTAEFGSDRQLVKRVIGLPGERVVIQSGQVTVYNNERPNGFHPDQGADYQDDIDDLTPGNVDITVPQGELFVLGDNRDNSSDSRAFGTIRSEEIVGTLSLRIYPFSSFKAF